MPRGERGTMSSKYSRDFFFPLRHRLLLILAAADENSSTGALPSPFSFTAENVCPTLLQFLFSTETPKLSAIDTVSRSSPKSRRRGRCRARISRDEPRKRLELRARLVEIKYRGRIRKEDVRRSRAIFFYIYDL